MDKVKVARIKGFFPMDKDGFIINPTSKEKIKSHWTDIIADIIVEYRNAYKDKVHSIYLRGSVAQGLDIGTVSDLDMFALLYNENGNYIHWKDVSWIKQFQKRLFEKYQLQNKIDLGYSTYVPDVREINLRIQMILKTQSLCVWGKDIIPEIGKFKPGKEMILNLKWLESDLNKTIEKLKTTENAEDIKELCTSIMKIIIRAGYELVIEREAKFTNQLYQCYESFSTYYPNKKRLMYHALELFVNPSENKSTIINIVEELGYWIVRKTVSET